MARVFVWGGAALLCGAAWSATLDLKAWLLWPSARATVTDVSQSKERSTAPTVAFVTADGGEVTDRSRLETPGDSQVGQTALVHNNPSHPSDPSDAPIPRAATIVLVVAGMGAVFMLLGSGATAPRRVAAPPPWVGTGWPVEQATIVRVVKQPGRLWRVPSWYLEIRGAAGETWQVPPMPFNPTRYLERRGSSEIDVARDPANPDQVWMDLGWLADAHEHDRDGW